MKDRLHKSALTLSGGQQQRLCLARATALHPEVLLLDEPCSALDPVSSARVEELIVELARKYTVLVVTHNLNLAARYADRLLLLHRGRTAAAGTPAQVLTKETVERVYGWPVAVAPHPGPGRDTGAPQVIPLAPEGTRPRG